MDAFKTNTENTWCPGCGNFGILRLLETAVDRLGKEGILPGSIPIVTGIGQHGKMFDYVNLSGFYSLHGRAAASAQGIKIGNPDLFPICFVGDGDSLGEGLSHLLYAAKRNADITVLLHDNLVYALTAGQASPLTQPGYKGPSTPKGCIEKPFNPITLLAEAGAGFIARVFPIKKEHFIDTVVKAVLHKGFSFVDVMQSCVTFQDTYKLLNEKTELMEQMPSSFCELYEKAHDREKIWLGIFKEDDEVPYHVQLYGDHNPSQQSMSKEDRASVIQKILAG